ncbi:MAG: hypothetical protein ING19_00520, partial [Azospirillum sp.]|nr:hypothetical protein [Azospirillum sp.]
ARASHALLARAIAIPASNAKDAKDARDRAILLLGFVAGLKRSEIAALDLESIDWHAGGVALRLRASSSGSSAGADVSRIDLPEPQDKRFSCAQALRAWTEIADLESRFEDGIRRTPLFRGIDKEGRILKERISGETIRLLVGARLRAAARGNAKRRSETLRPAPAIPKIGLCFDPARLSAALGALPPSSFDRRPKRTVSPPKAIPGATERPKPIDFEIFGLKGAIGELENVSTRVAGKIAGIKNREKAEE